MKSTSPIDYYNTLAREYDSLTDKGKWYSPEILFGLVFKNIKPKEKLLDLGIGTGLSSIPFKKAGLQIYGIDGSKELLSVCKKKNFTEDLKLFDLNNKKFPYPPNKFNHIISNGVLYFFKDLNHFFNETYRLLKKGGTFSFTVEDLKSKKSKSYINKDNNKISKRLLKKAGVKVYRHSEKYIKNLIEKYNFKLLKKAEYLAYFSPTEKKNIFFKAYILKK